MTIIYTWNAGLHGMFYLSVTSQVYQTVFVRSQHAPYKYSNFLANRYRKYLSFLKSAFTAVYLQ